MNEPVTRQQLQDTIALMVEQTELFPEDLNTIAQTLGQTDLEKLTITLHVAKQEAASLSEEDTAVLEKSLKRYFAGKKRIYQKSHQAWLAYHEAKQQDQESLFEEALLKHL